MAHLKSTLIRTFATLLMLVPLLGATAALAAPPTRGMLYNDGEILRTFVVPAPLPNGGIDPLYMVTNGVGDQLGIAAVAPGDADYHGGAWAIYTVTFNDGVTPYLLTSDEAVQAAAANGDVTVTRTPNLDNRCPVQS
jgi:hypothetical protein